MTSAYIPPIFVDGDVRIVNAVQALEKTDWCLLPPGWRPTSGRKPQFYEIHNPKFNRPSAYVYGKENAEIVLDAVDFIGRLNSTITQKEHKPNRIIRRLGHTICRHAVERLPHQIAIQRTDHSTIATCVVCDGSGTLIEGKLKSVYGPPLTTDCSGERILHGSAIKIVGLDYFETRWLPKTNPHIVA